ncbi:variable surface protein [Plasmodium gonderi]|uniref:Variable surface protein n=1 Tax=Plasmodium gonderi TaxID=77519 RepID=A0A1Y1JUT3_PLAGO|nr:variable surface protein [Plasmodium gonderi]GAW84173.1 variable surface protein [Plasmodium gonderi]
MYICVIIHKFSNYIIFMYKHVNFFPECNKIIGTYLGNTEPESKCSKSFFDRNIILNNRINEKQCNAALSYLYNIKFMSSHIDKEAASLYFYYWIYYLLQQKSESQHVKSVYEAFIKNHNNSYGENFKLINYTHYNDDVIQRLKVLYDIENTYKFIKDKCKPHNDDGFCDEIKIITNKYNPLKQTQSCERTDMKTQQTPKSNIIVPITITILIILIVSLFMFILYKIIPSDSFLRRGITCIRSKLCNIDEELNELQPYEMSKNESMNIRYNILYNYN